MRIAAATVLLVGALALTGCTAAGADSASGTPAPTTANTDSPDASSSEATVVSSVTAIVPTDLNEETISAETTRIAAAVQALIDPALIINVDDHAQFVDKTESVGRYYGILRPITLEPSVDAVRAATEIVSILESSGWINRDVATEADPFLSGLVSSKDDATSWFLAIVGDTSVAGQSVLSIQLASPDIP
ncbi:hypothetical protein [Leifsonia sp. A12D58]|uniref:hypothetical protein n=1 Tax=Leifsonia sp. A12D58 TaxID=3397674 RepID=UPI0039E0A2CC